MSISGREYLQHILAEADYLVRNSRDLTKEQFVRDETLKRAFVRSIEIIGEAAKNLPEQTRNAHPEIEWRAMSGMRDRLIHGYFGIDYELVWDVVSSKIPVLRSQVQAILGKAHDQE
jgi:uncharacterized protein with HEPN domain